MDFVISHRGPKGEMLETQVSAADRNGVFAEAEKLGIKSVVSVRSGKLSKNPRNVASSSSSPKFARGLIAGVFVVLIAGVVFFVVSNLSSPAPEEQQAKKPNLIEEVAPELSEPEVVAAEPPVVDPNARPTKVGEIVNGYIKLPSGRLHKIRGEVTNDVASSSKDWFAVFDYRCENEIACYLTMEPGETLVGTPVYRGQFTKEFLKSLETPIVANADDSDEIKALKRAVTEAKIELKAAYDRGEDIEKIMLDTHNQLQDLGCYKMALESDMLEMIKGGASSMDDVDSFVEAANIMLEKKGIAPMTLSPLAKKRLERMVEKKKGELLYE